MAVCSIVVQAMNGLRRNDVQPELLQLVPGEAASFELSAIRYHLRTSEPQNLGTSELRTLTLTQCAAGDSEHTKSEGIIVWGPLTHVFCEFVPVGPLMLNDVESADCSRVVALKSYR